VNEKLRKIIADALELSADEINESTAMESVDTWDSLRHMEMVVALEQEYALEFGADEMMEMTSFNEIKRVLGSKGIQC